MMEHSEKIKNAISRKTNERNLIKWQKKPSSRTDFGPLGPNLGHQNISSKIWPRQSIDIVISYHQVQYQKKLTIQS